MADEANEAIDWSMLFARFRGQRIALADDEVTVLAAGSTAKEASASSIPKGAPDPILYHVPDALDTFAGNEISI
jgi:hypothetical protein